MYLAINRCLIRPLSMEDAGALCSVLSDEAVMRHLEPPFDLGQTRVFIGKAGMCRPPRVFGIVWQASGELIGHLIFHPFEGSAYELGWVLRRDFWGMGIASELTDALIAHARAMGLSGLVIQCLPEQAATVRIAEKFGFSELKGSNEIRLFHLKL